jgi:hypothetical protein
MALLAEALTWRQLDNPKLKLRQIGFGMLEAGLPDLSMGRNATGAQSHAPGSARPVTEHLVR